MKKLKPHLERYWYQDATFRIANAIRTLLRAMLLVIGVTIMISAYVSGHVIKMIVHMHT